MDVSTLKLKLTIDTQEVLLYNYLLCLVNNRFYQKVTYCISIIVWCLGQNKRIAPVSFLLDVVKGD
jgi:hypothetical protein